MRWIKLYDKIGKQNIGIVQNTDVEAVIDGQTIPLTLKFKPDGKPYLVEIEKYNERGTT